ncbi:MAG: endonuclease V [Thaumarchaeota archaeon]|nr:MAG: endonuclease V [Nitrososphaerota archaeon]TLX95731.1 MAG: endonuclease V [Nitrososphaerota archaeon]
MISYNQALELQRSLSQKVVARDSIKKIRKVCAADVSYNDENAWTSAVVMDARTLEILEHITLETKVKIPYVPGLLMLRESKPILSALKLLKNNFDILIVDGNGQLHPRKCGIATYLGIVLDKPTIGVAKSLLCGNIKNNSVEFDGKILGKVIEKKKGKKIFVSVGNKISLRTAYKIIKSLIREGQWQPEPIRIADHYSKQRLSSQN